MSIQILENARVICSNRNSLHNYFAWPTVTRLPGGMLAMAASGLRLKHIDPFGKSVLCYSFDEGKTWTLPAVVLDTPLDDRDTGLTVFGNRVMVTSFNPSVSRQLTSIDTEEDHPIGILSPDSEYRLYDNGDVEGCRRRYLESYLHYLDAGKTEEDFLGSLYRISEDGGFTFGPVKKAPVTAPHGPAAASDGTLYYIGNPYRKVFSSSDLECWKLDEDGEFRMTGTIPNVPDLFDGKPVYSYEPHAIVLPDGRILVHIRVQSAYDGWNPLACFAVWQSESTDGGKTFTVPRPISEDPTMGAPAHLLRLRDGTLVSVYGWRESPFGIRAMISRDDGNTWSAPVTLYENQGISLDLGYPASVERKDGSILTVFYAHPESGAPAEILQVIWRVE